MKEMKIFFKDSHSTEYILKQERCQKELDVIDIKIFSILYRLKIPSDTLLNNLTFKNPSLMLIPALPCQNTALF